MPHTNNERAKAPALSVEIKEPHKTQIREKHTEKRRNTKRFVQAINARERRKSSIVGKKRRKMDGVTGHRERTGNKALIRGQPGVLRNGSK